MLSLPSRVPTDGSPVGHYLNGGGVVSTRSAGRRKEESEANDESEKESKKETARRSRKEIAQGERARRTRKENAQGERARRTGKEKPGKERNGNRLKEDCPASVRSRPCSWYLFARSAMCVLAIAPASM